jgi:hypothetical protein
MSNAPATAPVAPKKKMSGCMLAVLIVGALLLLGAIAVATVVVLALRTPEGAAAVDMVKAASRANTGPGADALRKYGCQSVAVLPVAALNQIASRADAGPVIADVAVAMVTCQNPPADRACDAMAAAYVLAERPSGPIHFSIADGERDRCAGYYDTSGRPMATTAYPR